MTNQQLLFKSIGTLGQEGFKIECTETLCMTSTSQFAGKNIAPKKTSGTETQLLLIGNNRLPSKEETKIEKILSTHPPNNL